MYKNALKEDLIRVVEELDGIVESTDTIVKLKTKIENSSTFESDPDFVKTLIQNCIDERVSQNESEVTSEQKIELAKLQLAKLEKEIELQLAKNKALSLNPAAKVEEKQFETNIENMIKSIKTLSLPVPTRSENFNLFFQSLERAFLTKKINDEYKSEILINLLGERAHNVLLRDIHQFAARLTANFQYYCSLRKVNSFESLCDLIISDKLFETLNKETATHIGIREAEDWFRPIDLAKECDIYISSRSGSHKEIPITYGYTQDPFKNRSQNFKPKIKENYPQYLERKKKIALYAVIHLIAQESSEIEKLGHAKSDVLLNESESSLGAHAYAYSSAISFPNVSVSNVIENSSYDLPYVKNFNTRNDSSSLIKDYKCNKIKITKLKLSIVREKCSDIVLYKKANGAMKTSSVEFISRSPNPLPMKSKHHRFVLLEGSSSPGSGNEGKREIVLNRRPELYRGKYRCVQPKINSLKRRSYACEKQCFPVEPSGCRRGAST
ncbi:integrase catalytic domain-containing protein [Trichonephila clavipes]|nr:integrase catalytic domain-containing protein [Trichonephila clavipes]